MAVRAPRSVKQATKLLEQYASIEGQIAAVEAVRTAALAKANGEADVEAQPLLGQRAAIAEKLQPWWAANAAELTNGERKSIELGGCMIGSRSGRASLAVDGDEKAIAKSLARRTWAKGLFRVTVSLDRAALMKALDGAYKRQLRALGLSRKPGEEQFFIERTEQAGTLGGN